MVCKGAGRLNTMRDVSAFVVAPVLTDAMSNTMVLLVIAMPTGSIRPGSTAVGAKSGRLAIGAKL